MDLIVLFSLFFFLLKAASDVALIVIAYVALQFLRQYVVPSAPSRLSRVLKAAKAELFAKR